MKRKRLGVKDLNIGRAHDLLKCVSQDVSEFIEVFSARVSPVFAT